ncbi:MAG TPA: enoyl-CoA hydratase/isomerase family protein [Chloroflexota bacterium]|nr:enoyl-CoA hydratase/isomerase family protein [Chloroflexota bacterium]
MAYQNLLLERAEGGVGIVTLNRPEVLNALSQALIREYDDALTELDQDEAIRCVIVTGAGEKAFCAGADIHEAVARGGEDGNLGTRGWQRASLSKPTIGAINGLAFGGGALISSELDIRIGCERTRFRFLQASVGRVGGTWSLPLVVGWPRAKELLFTARVVEAEEALQIGLVNRLVPAAQLMDSALEMARQIAGNKPEAVQGIKQLLTAQVGRGWQEMMESERTFRSKVAPPPPPTEAFKDFLARKPKAPAQ